MINKLRIFLTKKHQIYFVFLIIGMFVSAILEMVGIGSIPVFINLLLDSEKLYNFIPSDKLINFLLSMDYLDRVLFGSLLLVFIFISKNIYLFLLIVFQGKLFRDIKIYNSKKLYNIYINNPLIFHINRNPAVLNRNLLGEVIISSNYLDGLALITRESLVLLVILVLLLLFDPIVSSYVLLGVGIISALFYFFVKNNVKRLSKINQIFKALQIKNINQVFGSIKETKVLNLSDYFTSEFESQTTRVEKNNFLLDVVQKLPRILIEVIAIIGILVVAFLYISQGFSFAEMIPMIGLLAVCTVRLIPSFNIITSTLTRLKTLSVSFNYILSEYNNLETKMEKRDLGQKKNNSFFNKNINLVNVDFSYPNTSKKVLKNLSLEIKKGEIVGIIGKSGSGKTTLIDIILGLLKISNGKILIDNQNLYANLGNWQSLLGYIPQDIYLIDDTVLKNVAFGIDDKYVEKNRVESALKSAQIYNFVSSLPEGLNAIVGNRGVKLSGGQKQRIGIARALYRNPRILVLDEATSSLDIETESNFMKNIYDLRGKKTLIISTHRLSTLKKCDKIFLVKNGEIKQTGSFSDLLNSYDFIKEDFNNNKDLKNEK